VLLLPFIVLFVSVSLPASVASVPVSGRVTEVVFVVVKVTAWLPTLVRVAALSLATPVPPLAGVMRGRSAMTIPPGGIPLWRIFQSVSEELY
jgi:Na+/glutamate symporter